MVPNGTVFQALATLLAKRERGKQTKIDELRLCDVGFEIFCEMTVLTVGPGDPQNIAFTIIIGDAGSHKEPIRQTIEEFHRRWVN